MRPLCVLLSSFLLISSASFAEDRSGRHQSHGLSRRIPWNDSRVVGSPDPPPPYKVVRAFPRLTVKQPLEPDPRAGDRPPVHPPAPQLLGRAGPPARRPRRPGRDRDRDPARHRRPRRRPGLPPRLRAQRLPLHRPERPDARAGTRRPRSCATRSTAGRRTGSTRRRSSSIIEWPSNGHDGGDLAFGNDGYPLRLLGRRLQRLRRQPDRPDPRRPAGGRAADRRRSPRPGPELRRARRTTRSSTAPAPGPSSGPTACATPGG